MTPDKYTHAGGGRELALRDSFTGDNASFIYILFIVFAAISVTAVLIISVWLVKAMQPKEAKLDSIHVEVVTPTKKERAVNFLAIHSSTATLPSNIFSPSLPKFVASKRAKRSRKREQMKRSMVTSVEASNQPDLLLSPGAKVVSSPNKKRKKRKKKSLNKSNVSGIQSPSSDQGRLQRADSSDADLAV